VRSPAEKDHDLIGGGAIPPPQIGSVPEPPIFKPQDIYVPPPKIEFTPLPDFSGEMGGVFSIVIPIGILIASIMMGLSRRWQEQGAQGSEGAFSGVWPQSHDPMHGGRSFVNLGADGKGGIMYWRQG